MSLYRTIFALLLIVLQLNLLGQKVERVISLAPSITKNIYYLNAQSKLVGCTSYCTEALNDQIPVIASAIKVNLEKIASLSPDLVLVTTITNTESIEMLKSLGIRVEIFGTPKSFNEICDQFIRLGKLLNTEETANQIVLESKAKVEQLSSEVSIPDHKKVFLQIGTKPLFTVLPNTFMNDFITIPGGENIAKNMKHGTITRESVLNFNPDYIFIVTMGVLGEEEKETWSSFKELKAAVNKNIFIIDAEKACSPTPITFIETLEAIVNLTSK